MNNIRDERKREIRPLRNRNPSLFLALKQFSEEAIGIAQSKLLEGMALLAESEPEWQQVATEKNTYRRQISTSPHYIVLFYRLREVLFALESFKKVSGEIEGDSTWKSHMNELVGSPLGSSRIDAEKVLFGILGAVLRRQETIQFNEREIEKEIEWVDEQLQSPTIEYFRLTPLRGIALEEKLILTDCLSIEPLSVDQVKEVLSLGLVRSSSFGMNDDFIHSAPSVAVVCRFLLPKMLGGLGNEESVKRSSERLIALFNRLAQDERSAIDLITLVLNGAITPLGSVTKSTGFASGSCSIQRMPVVDGWMTPVQELTSGHCSEIKRFWPLASGERQKRKSNLEIAIRRFSHAMSRSSPDDQLIDLMICAESLYFNDDSEQSELSHRLSYRAALLLGQTPQEKKHIFRFMKSAYNKRSKVVHGKVHTTDRKEAEELAAMIKELSEYLRRTILRLLEMASNPNPHKGLVDWTRLMFGEDVVSPPKK